MQPEIDITTLTKLAASLLGQPLASWSRPPFGADHLVLLATTRDGRDVVVKAGSEADVDGWVLERLAPFGARVPRLLARGAVAGRERVYPVTIMSRIDGRLLADLPNEQQARYLPSLVDEVRRAHRVTTSGGAGPVLDVLRGRGLRWTEYLLRVLSGDDSEFHWDEIARAIPDARAVVAAGLDWLSRRVARLEEPGEFNLLHGDLNPHNVFVDDDEVIGLIDWSYARFGDPLFDFARLRMNPLVRSNPRALDVYVRLLGLTTAARGREAVYYVFHLMEYVNWYFLDGSLDRVAEHLALVAQVSGSRGSA